MKKYSLLVLLMWISNLVFGQNQTDVAMDSGWVTDGKIYVVILCVLVLFAVLLTFLFNMDKKLKKIEKNMTDKI